MPQSGHKEALGHQEALGHKEAGPANVGKAANWAQLLLQKSPAITEVRKR